MISGAFIFLFFNKSGISTIFPIFLILGYFSFKTFDGKSAISENHSNLNPKGFQAMDAASIPEQTLPTVYLFFFGIFSKSFLRSYQY